MELEFSRQIFEKYSNVKGFMEILLVGVELFLAEGQTDSNEAANNRFS